MTNLPQDKYPRPLDFGNAKPFPSGQKDFLRFCQGEKVQYAIDLPPEFDGAELDTLGNLPQGVPEISDQKTNYPSIDLSKCDPGRFHFKLRIKKDGKEWVDSAGYSHMMVDPKRTNNIRLYSLIPNITGTIDDWILELDRIADLGFNMVHLLPITPMDQSGSPYSAYSFYGVDKIYLKSGGANLQNFVDKAKSLNIGLCFDLVLNHVGFTSEMATQCPEWIQSDAKSIDGLKRAGCWAGEGWLTWEDLVLINYDHPNDQIRQDIWNYMLDVILYWGEIANATRGMLRLDNLHSTHPMFLEWAMKILNQTYPNVIILGELFTSPEEQKRMVLDHQLNLLLSTPWDKHFVPDLRDQVEYIHSVYPQIKFIFPISSHDSGTPTQEFYDIRATVPRYAVATLLNCGSTGMCQGVEFGAPSKLEFIGFKGRQEITGPLQFHDEIREFNKMMMDYCCLRQGGNLSFIDQSHGAIMGAYRHSHDPKCAHLVILINLDLHHEQNITIQADGKSLFSSDELKSIYGVPAGYNLELPCTIKLLPCGVKIFEVLR